MPLPTKTPSTPSCMHRAASAGVATPPAAKLTTGSLPGTCRSGQHQQASIKSGFIFRKAWQTRPQMNEDASHHQNKAEANSM